LTVRLSTALLALVLAPTLLAQKTAPLPTRPGLGADADTNDSHSYYQLGVRTIDSKPEDAVRAFFWASKIDPASGEALYAMRAAALMQMTPTTLFDYYDYSNKKRKPEFLALDSLLFRAYAINPFLYRSLDRALVPRIMEADMRKGDPERNVADLNRAILNYTMRARNSAWVAYSQGRLTDALDAYAKELKDFETKYNKRNKHEYENDGSEIHAERSRIFFLVGNMDSSLTEMNAAKAGLRERETGFILYESNALYDQSIGMIHEKAKHADLARESYAHALEEDLSYYSAHMNMASLQLAQGDTAGAVSEMNLAVQMQPNDPALRYGYAVILVQARRDADAVQQLMKAIAADPYYAAPRLLLARISDVEAYTEEAVEGYQEFVALAPRSDPQLPMVKTRLAALTSTVAQTPAKP
jgi:tetratricopeptide (TPR) repeat protein